MTPDAINGLFEVGGSLLICLNIRQLLRDRRVAGVHWAPTAFFTTWGLWNCYFYPSLDQWMSFCGGLAIVMANAVWLGLVFKYRKGCAMKILSITPSLSEVIETDLPDWPTYRRYSADCWENLMGESWETENYPENLERLYQEAKQRD